MTVTSDVANEDLFPGNLNAIERLRSHSASNRLVGLVGSGVSIPLAPSWGGLLGGLIDTGLVDGFVSPEDEASLRQEIDSDPLELASTLEEALTSARFRAFLAQKFRINGTCTQAHEAVMRLNWRGIITLNYDDGLSTAYVRRFQQMPNVIRADDRYELHRWAVSHASAEPSCPLIHWHGSIAAPDRMILTADDYDRFYAISENKSFIEELWRSQHILAIGFGFRDPVFTRLAETVLRGLAGPNQHFALVGRDGSKPLTPLIRKQFSKKYRVDPIFYNVIVKDGVEDHSGLIELLALVADHNQQAATPTVQPQAVILKQTPTATADQEFKEGLFVGPNGQTLYVEPRLISQRVDTSDGTISELQLSVRDVVSQTQNMIINSPIEAGGTTLARRLIVDFISDGYEAVYRDSVKLPNYKKKLLDDKSLRPSQAATKTKGKVLLLDNFDIARHERILKEIIGLGTFDRVIVFSRNRGDDITNLDDLGLEAAFQPVFLEYLNRSDVRELASQLYDTFDGDLVSAAVEKTYNDLLELCIPLTPSNVVMYLSVVHREGSFTPLNRLQIMERFIRDLLHRPGDLYKDAFNADNKMDVIGSFVYYLFLEQKASFTKDEWNTFCEAEMADSLIWFDKSALLEDLESTRLFVQVGSEYVFKYKLFYTYFVGKYIAQRLNDLREFLKNDHHLKIDSLVEVIAGTSRDNTVLVTDLVGRLEASIAEFEKTYGITNLDPYEDIVWLDHADEHKNLWQPVGEKLAAGPAEDSEVDKLKRSIVAESRTADQNVVIREFSDYQKSITFLQGELIAALRESQKLNRDLKARSMRAIYKCYQIGMQIGFLFAPIIATRRFFVWNDLAFYNQMNWSNYGDASKDDQIGMIAGAIPRAVVNKAADELGSRKLGALFEYVARGVEGSNFETYLTFSLILRSKPEGWQETIRTILNKTDRSSLYLRYMLNASLRQFNQEVNTSGERTGLKRVVANIQAKRLIKKANPNTKAIDQTLRRLELQKYFERTRDANNAVQKADLPALEAEAEKLLETGAIDVVADNLAADAVDDLGLSDSGFSTEPWRDRDFGR